MQTFLMLYFNRTNFPSLASYRPLLRKYWYCYNPTIPSKHKYIYTRSQSTFKPFEPRRQALRSNFPGHCYRHNFPWLSQIFREPALRDHGQIPSEQRQYYYPVTYCGYAYYRELRGYTCCGRKRY